MARYLKLTQLYSAKVINRPEVPPSILLNMDHIVSISEMPISGNYPNGGSIVTMSSIGEGGISEAYYVNESVDAIARVLPI